MSYQVLARKWRPAQFDQVVGQGHVLNPLQHALDNQRLHHAYLFTGTRGVGKTTIARILAKALNCEQGVSANPCGQCEACQEIEQGRFVDLLEIDAASRTKVEDTRELLDNVQYRPTRGRYKVYLIDEVHMLSRHSFNALLKTLEEPPEHVKFLLATTDPQKLPVTVVSRCLQFNLRALTSDLISEQLSYVLQQEQVPFEANSLSLLAKAAKGSMRDGLSLTDQAIAQGNGEVKLESVQQMLGNVPSTDIQALLNDIIDGDGNRLFQRLDKIAGVIPSMSAVLSEMQALLHRLALVQALPKLASEDESSAEFKQLLRKLPAEVIQLYYRLVLEGRKELPHAVDERAGVEMTLLRLLAFQPTNGQQWLASDDTAIEPAKAEPAQQASPEPAPEPEPESQPESEPMAEPEPVPSPTPEPVAEDIPPAPQASDDSLSDLLQMRQQLAQQNNADAPAAAESEKKNDEVVPAEETPSQPSTTTSEPIEGQQPTEEVSTSLAAQLPQLTETIRLAQEVDDWSALIAAMDISGLARQMLLNSNLREVQKGHWQIAVAPEQQSLISDATVDSVCQALKDTLSPEGNFEVTVEEPQQPTPLMIQQHINAYRHQLAVDWIHQDPSVKELQQRFAAEIDESSITAV